MAVFGVSKAQGSKVICLSVGEQHLSISVFPQALHSLLPSLTAG